MMRPDAKVEKVYLYPKPVDFRKSIDGLAALVELDIKVAVFDPVLFVFLNKPRNRVKILYWERNGFCLWLKRLESERFKTSPDVTDEAIVLSMLGSQLHGSWEISLVSGRDRPDGAGKATSQKPAAYASEKSDNSVVPEKLPNNGLAPAEVMEERELAKGNSEQPSASRTQSRTSVLSGLLAVRQAARRD